ncbi:PP2C family serine/threonine-protein phosphatase [Agromyces laixinhei]|uniref:PP2C family serine/threonine-protein phosphatase n=1 Tax=Agromyces laixinhei TaxID=2585717 RepID=UPI0012ECD5B1|nr:PP2C family serine/threonine-protein phosphatase [Agromyces laixinhei]
MFNEFHYQVRGRGHEQDGTRGQDRTGHISRGGVQALCLADGAGSATQSELGAQAVVDEGCALLVEGFTRLVSASDAEQSRRDILERLHGRLDEVAERNGCTRVDLASTFLAVAATNDRFMVAHVGDGVIGYVRNGKLLVVSAPDNAEFANQTTFVTSPDAATSIRLFRGSMEGVSGFVLMSDGASASLYDFRAKTLAPACAKLIDVVRNAPTRQVRNPSYKKHLRRLVDTKLRLATKDDCAIGILGRRP